MTFIQTYVSQIRLIMAQFASGRHYTRYNYTTHDVARLTGRAVGTVRNDVASGRLVMGDLVSVARYIVEGNKARADNHGR